MAWWSYSGSCNVKGKNDVYQLRKLRSTKIEQKLFHQTLRLKPFHLHSNILLNGPFLKYYNDKLHKSTIIIELKIEFKTRLALVIGFTMYIQ